MREYRNQFEAISSHLKIHDADIISSMFSNGLKEEIWAEVRLPRPMDLEKMMDVALLAEEKVGLSSKTGGNSQGKSSFLNRGSGGFKSWKTESNA